MKYVHTNIIAKDWRRISKFYQNALGCIPAPPERDLSGEWIDALTGMKGAHITGEHLRLPGYGDDGPTLEIFHYDSMPERPEILLNTPGLTHLAFLVDDVDETAQRFIECGGSAVGKIVSQTYASGKTIVVCYMADPEGNIVELQTWKD